MIKTRLLDPAGLDVGQLAGDWCAIPNCRRRLTGPRTLLGALPDGTPIFICGDHEVEDL